MSYEKRVQELMPKLPADMQKLVKKYNNAEAGIEGVRELHSIVADISIIHCPENNDEKTLEYEAHMSECSICQLTFLTFEFIRFWDDCDKEGEGLEFQENFLIYKRDHLKLALTPEELEFMKPLEPPSKEDFLRWAENTKDPEMRMTFLILAGSKKHDQKAAPGKQAE